MHFLGYSVHVAAHISTKGSELIFSLCGLADVEIPLDQIVNG